MELRGATESGPVSLRFELKDGGETVKMTYRPHFHHAPERVVLHAPPLPGLKRIEVNGETREVAPGEAVAL